jgi:hypothetical protein
LGIKSK